MDSRKSDNVGSRQHSKRKENSSLETSRRVDTVGSHSLFESAFGHGVYVALDLSLKSSNVSSGSRLQDTLHPGETQFGVTT